MTRRTVILSILLLSQITIGSLWSLQSALGDEVKKSPQDTPRVISYKYQSDQLLKIVEVRNLQKDTWLTDLEVELKNVSGKPIYLLQLWLDLPEVPPVSGSGTTILWSYGNRNLMNNDRLADPTDEPIKPGESFIFKPPKDQAEIIQQRIAKENIPEASKAILEFYIINFGDGSGYLLGQPAKDRLKRPDSETK